MIKREILIYNETKIRVPKKFIENIISKTLDFLKLKQPVEMAILIVGNEEIRKLNKTWRKKNYAPDELSFGLNSRKKANLAKRQNKVLELGDIVINDGKISNKKYLATLLIHSLLHLLGYNHERSIAEAKKMEELEIKILKHVA